MVKVTFHESVKIINEFAIYGYAHPPLLQTDFVNIRFNKVYKKHESFKN